MLSHIYNRLPCPLSFNLKETMRYAVSPEVLWYFLSRKYSYILCKKHISAQIYSPPLPLPLILVSFFCSLMSSTLLSRFQRA